MSIPRESLEPSTPAAVTRGAGPDAGAPVPVGFDPFELSRLRDELRTLRFISDLSARLEGTRDVESTVRFVVRACLDHFGASAACFAVSDPRDPSASLLFSLPQERLWDLPLFAAATAGHKPPIDPMLMFARIRRRDRGWGLLALARSTGEFDRSQRQALVKIGVTVSALIGEADAHRIREVRDRIDRKIMEELQPIDLSYQILDALRSLTRYDHSSAVLMSGGISGSSERVASVELVAEQIAWRKGKSTRIGTRFDLSPRVRDWLESDIVYGFTRNGPSWQEWDARPMSELAELLDYNRSDGDEPEHDMLCAPLRGRDGVVGLLKVSARHPGTFIPYDAGLMRSFLPQASLALQHAQRTESLKGRIVAAERKQLMANLARGVSHDLKNALGAILPTVQQLVAEAEDGSLESQRVREDLREIERGVQVCRRIFQGMLSSARREAGAAPCGNLRHAIDGTLAILQDGMRRQGVVVRQSLCDPLPSLLLPQSDLEQLLLNVFTNAREAMLDGGTLDISAEPHGNAALRVVITDTGCGIPAELLPRVMDLFYTTKPDGTGLGLANCRSIVDAARGKIAITSELSRGTSVTFVIPVET